MMRRPRISTLFPSPPVSGPGAAAKPGLGGFVRGGVATTPAAYRPIIEEVASSAEPMARSVTPLPVVRSLAVLPGAYNPPTKAHLALATAALERAFEPVAFSVGTVTIDKPEVGLGLDERLHLLCELCRD